LRRKREYFELEKGKRDAVFHPEFVEDLQFWAEKNDRIAARTFELIEAVMRDPHSGIGKPEPLTFLVEGAWSRRLTQEHRIIYLISESRVDFLQTRYHY
jgi:toxin YoeB